MSAPVLENDELAVALKNYELARVAHDRAATRLYRMLDRRRAHSQQLLVSVDCSPVGPAQDKARLIIQRVATFYNVSPTDIIGPRRLATLVVPRHLAMTYIRSLLRMPYAAIAAIFGGRDHATVLNAERTVRTRCELDAAYKQTHAFLLQQCREALEQAGKPVTP